MEPTSTEQIMLTVCEGDNVILNSSFDFSNFIDVTWKKTTRDGLIDATNGIYNPCDFSYMIRNVSQSDSKVYVPSAVNPEESTGINGPSTDLRVLPKPS